MKKEELEELNRLRELEKRRKAGNRKGGQNWVKTQTPTMLQERIRKMVEARQKKRETTS